MGQPARPRLEIFVVVVVVVVVVAVVVVIVVVVVVIVVVVDVFRNVLYVDVVFFIGEVITLP